VSRPSGRQAEAERASAEEAEAERVAAEQAEAERASAEKAAVRRIRGSSDCKLVVRAMRTHGGSAAVHRSTVTES
jgi:hypothetical protein